MERLKERREKLCELLQAERDQLEVKICQIYHCINVFQLFQGLNIHVTDAIGFVGPKMMCMY